MGPFRLANLDLRQLRVFIAVVEHEGVSAAALATGASLYSVSRNLSALEKRLGVRLCRRGRGGFDLTPQGREIYQAAMRMLLELNEFEWAVLTIQRALGGKLEVGIIDNVLTNVSCGLVAALKAFGREYPDTLVNISVFNASVIDVHVRERRLDLALTGQPQWLQSLDYVAVFGEEHRLYVSRSSPHFSTIREIGRNLSGGRCPPLPYVKRNYRTDALASFENLYPLRVVGSGNTIEAVTASVMAGLGCGILPRHYVESITHRDLVEMDLKESHINVMFYLVYRKDAAGHPAIRSVLRQFEASAARELSCVAAQP